MVHLRDNQEQFVSVSVTNLPAVQTKYTEIGIASYEHLSSSAFTCVDYLSSSSLPLKSFSLQV